MRGQERVPIGEKCAVLAAYPGVGLGVGVGVGVGDGVGVGVGVGVGIVGASALDCMLGSPLLIS
ncbi:hypothetical protein CKY28_11740 [Sphingomonas lenta]|uniref:Uncharacterized protein n=1 Tax=Sphingomonas lenta TaxID=1141887 RepID=A0A2A2SGL4_9SPHN|nr:hypothetical protein CKY28_11740 [Sphingomonas lenta]